MEKQVNLLKPAEVAKVLNVSLQSIYKWAHKGLLPCVKVCNAVRFDPVIVEKARKNGVPVYQEAA